MLGVHGFDVTMASSYEEALQLLQKAPYEVLLTDLRMNGPDGLELIRATQASSPATRPILMSAYATARDSQTALDLGAVRVRRSITVRLLGSTPASVSMQQSRSSCTFNPRISAPTHITAAISNGTRAPQLAGCAQVLLDENSVMRRVKGT